MVMLVTGIGFLLNIFTSTPNTENSHNHLLAPAACHALGPPCVSYFKPKPCCFLSYVFPAPHKYGMAMTSCLAEIFSLLRSVCEGECRCGFLFPGVALGSEEHGMTPWWQNLTIRLLAQTHNCPIVCDDKGRSGSGYLRKTEK